MILLYVLSFVGYFIGVIGYTVVIYYRLTEFRKTRPQVRMYALLDSADKDIYDQTLNKFKNKTKKVLVYTSILLIVIPWSIVLTYMLGNVRNIGLITTIGNLLAPFTTLILSVIFTITMLLLTYFMVFKWWPAIYIPWVEVLTQNGINTNDIMKREPGESRIHATIYRSKKLYILIRSFIKWKYPNKPSYHLIDKEGNIMDFEQSNTSLDEEYKGYIMANTIQASVIKDLKISGKFLQMRRVQYIFSMTVIFALVLILSFIIFLSPLNIFNSIFYFYISVIVSLIGYFVSAFVGVYYSSNFSKERLQALLGDGYPGPLHFSPRTYPKLVEIVEQGFPFISL